MAKAGSGMIVLGVLVVGAGLVAFAATRAEVEEEEPLPLPPGEADLELGAVPDLRVRVG